MKIEGDAKQVTIFVNSTDQWHGRPLYAVIVQRSLALPGISFQILLSQQLSFFPGILASITVSGIMAND